MTDYYKDMLEKGLEYQDFITDLLLKEIGISISTYASRRYQREHGENAQGVEIKFDDMFAETGNIYIEVAEKSAPDNPRFVPSGIYREDNTWLYVIGNYEVVYIFSKKFLALLHQSRKLGYKRVSIPTSQGFLIPERDVVRYCLKQIIPLQIEQHALDWEAEGVV